MPALFTPVTVTGWSVCLPRRARLSNRWPECVALLPWAPCAQCAPVEMPPVSAIPEHSEGSNRVQVMFGFRSSDRVAPGPSRIASPFPSRQVFSKTQRFSPRDARDGGRKRPAYNAPPDSDFKLVSAGVGETKAGTSDKSATGRFLSRCATRPCKAPRRGAGPS